VPRCVLVHATVINIPSSLPIFNALQNAAGTNHVRSMIDRGLLCLSEASCVYIYNRVQVGALTRCELTTTFTRPHFRLICCARHSCVYSIVLITRIEVSTSALSAFPGCSTDSPFDATRCGQRCFGEGHCNAWLGRCTCFL
jgi:hypothetical protein